MKKSGTFLCVLAVLLYAGPAMASHCDTEIANLESAMAAAQPVEPNVADAVEALAEHAIATCQHEEGQLATAEPDSPLLDPDHVTVGRAILIHAKQLLENN